MIRTVFSGLTVVLALLAAPLPAYAQETTGEVRGQIVVSGTDDPFIVPVRLYDAIGNLVTERRNLPDGTFSFTGLTPGTYHVQAADQWYSGKSSFAESDPVVVTPGGSTQGVDFTLEFNDLGWIEGRVYDAETNEPLCITVAEQIRTREDGTYTLGLYPGPWKISFQDSACMGGSMYETQWWDGKRDEASADVIEVMGGALITGIDAAMSPPEDEGGWISGTVTDAETGDGVWGICAIPYHESGERVEFAPLTVPDPSAQDGTYRIGFLGEGTFRVEFADCQNFVYETVWWRDADSFETADPISVALGEEVSGIDVSMQLEPGATRPAPRPDPGAGGPVGPVESAGGTEPGVQSGGAELPFTGTGQPLGWLAVLATVTLGLGVMLVGRRTRTPNTDD